MIDTQVRILPLTPSFPCNDCELERAPLYAAFSAAKDLLKSIQRDAEEFVKSSPPAIPIPYRFSDIQSLCQFPRDSWQEERIHFQITRRLGDDMKSHLLYIANTLDFEPKIILVKFSRKYGKELHEFCASHNYAPKLLAFEELPGGWLAIAMEYFPSAFHVTESPSLVEHRETWLKKMDEVVKVLHKHDYVHGDLCPPNFTVDEERLLLIDFDWGGKEGQATFPDAQLHPIL